MSVNQRLTALESRLAAGFPTFDVACARRWTLAQWFKRLSRQADIRRVRAEVSGLFTGWPTDDGELRRQLATWPADFEVNLPAGSMPTAPPDETPADDNAAGDAKTNDVRVA